MMKSVALAVGAALALAGCGSVEQSAGSDELRAGDPVEIDETLDSVLGQEGDQLPEAMMVRVEADAQGEDLPETAQLRVVQQQVQDPEQAWQQSQTSTDQDPTGTFVVVNADSKDQAEGETETSEATDGTAPLEDRYNRRRSRSFSAGFVASRDRGAFGFRHSIRSHRRDRGFFRSFFRPILRGIHRIRNRHSYWGYFDEPRRYRRGRYNYYVYPRPRRTFGCSSFDRRNSSFGFNFRRGYIYSYSSRCGGRNYNRW